MIKYLLDTNICIDVIKRRPLEALARFNEAAGYLAISSVTLAELLHGVEKSQCQRGQVPKGSDPFYLDPFYFAATPVH
jgi:predicted nucleic acid-binding protein